MSPRCSPLFAAAAVLLGGCILVADEAVVRVQPERRIVHTASAPAPVGPYSQAVQVGDALYLAGQIGLDPGTGELAPGGIEPETRQVMENLGAVLAEAGFGFGDVVLSQVFLADLADFAAMNGVYAGFFPAAPPARATVGVSLPRGARVEILMTAVRSR